MRENSGGTKYILDRHSKNGRYVQIMQLVKMYSCYLWGLYGWNNDVLDVREDSVFVQ